MCARKKIILLFLFAFVSQNLQAQPPCACCSDNYKAFDFWIGEWVVFDTSGNKIGENKIEKLEDNCLLTEQWKGAKGGSGRSTNYYDAADSSWHQVWVDNRGGNLVLKGRASTNKMSLKSALQKDPKGSLYANRITWTLNADGSVTQRWEMIDANDHFISIAFIGIYKKK